MLLPPERLYQLDYYQILPDCRRVQVMGGDIVSYDRIALNWKPVRCTRGFQAWLYDWIGGGWLIPYPPITVESTTLLDFARIRDSDRRQTDGMGFTWTTVASVEFTELKAQLQEWVLHQYDDNLLPRPTLHVEEASGRPARRRGKRNHLGDVPSSE